MDINCGVVEFATAGTLMFNARDTQAAGGVTVSFSAATDSGIALDTRGDRSVAYITVEDQYSIDVAPEFTAIIDVEDERTTFALPTMETDTSSVTVEDDDGKSAIDFETELSGCRFSLVRQLRVDHRR